jgi:FtsZ-interacting cell division protein ZipA
MNWTVGIIIIVLLSALLVYLIWRNNKDENKFENDMNNDYKKTKDREGDIETE